MNKEIIIQTDCQGRNPRPHTRKQATKGVKSARPSRLSRTAAIKDAECQDRVEKIFREIEALFADGTRPLTFIRGKDKKAAVENCQLIMASEWQALKKQEGVK